MLIIGWRGVEMHVLKLLRAIPRGVPGLIVSGSADGAEDVRTRLTGAGLPVDFATCTMPASASLWWGQESFPS
jgi:hypothetical protein